MIGKNNEIKRIDSAIEVSTFLDRLKYAIEYGHCRIDFIKERNIDKNRDAIYSNKYTLDDLFPNREPIEVLKKELLELDIGNYIETVQDIRHPKKGDMWVFGQRKFRYDVYIKLRVKLVDQFSGGSGNVLVMSFHRSTRDFEDQDFPYK